MEIFHRPPTAKRPAATFTGEVLVGSRDGIVIEAHPGDPVYTAPAGAHRSPTPTTPHPAPAPADHHLRRTHS